ncbi:Uncharacterized protein dnm_086210 [Desulfonema magnum]|uniref:Uncharacterized protein n=1 Tax=Desulfonema magnum TaxID=45655 RepID=A0A975BWF3_9BACT|nr:Uncharacterized protein dnm_086210 [Desulfonema magnum]
MSGITDTGLCLRDMADIKFAGRPDHGETGSVCGETELTD